MIKVVFFDLDGTILSHTKFGVPASCKEAIKQLQSQGIQCVLATGRHIRELEELPVNDIEFDSYLLANCQIFLDKNRNYISGIPIEGKEKDKIIEIFNNKDFAILMNERERVYVNMYNDVYKRGMVEAHLNKFDIDEYRGDDFYQICVFVDKEDEDKLKEMIPTMVCARWCDWAVDFVYQGHNKATGIAEYCKLMGFDQSETMCFGDGENDIAMLKYCHYGVAMDNGIQEAKDSGNHITTHIDDDGILNGLKAFGLIGQQQMISDALEFVKEYFNNDCSGHDYQHTYRVYQLAKNIAQKYECDVTKVCLAALLHDVDDRKLVGDNNNFANTREYLLSHNFAPVYIEEIIHIISQVSFKGKDSVVPDTIEGKIVQDADRLDAIGAIGIARTFAYGGSRGITMYDSEIKPLVNADEKTYFNHKSTTINHFYEKLLLLKDMMNTEVAKEMAIERTEYMEEFLRRFYNECEGK